MNLRAAILVRSSGVYPRPFLDDVMDRCVKAAEHGHVPLHLPDSIGLTFAGHGLDFALPFRLPGLDALFDNAALFRFQVADPTADNLDLVLLQLFFESRLGSSRISTRGSLPGSKHSQSSSQRYWPMIWRRIR